MKKQILIIDNDTPELKKLRELLAQNGYGILTATDAEIGKTILNKLPVDFILTKANYFPALCFDVKNITETS